MGLGTVFPGRLRRDPVQRLSAASQHRGRLWECSSFSSSQFAGARTHTCRCVSRGFVGAPAVAYQTSNGSVYQRPSNILELWLAEHLSDPYPQREEHQRLADAAGLSVRQVTAWFSRTRQRKLPRCDEDSNFPCSQQTLDVRGVYDAAEGYPPLDCAARKATSAQLSSNASIPEASSLSVVPASSRECISDNEEEPGLRRAESALSFSLEKHEVPLLALSTYEGSHLQWYLDGLPTSPWDAKQLLHPSTMGAGHFGSSTDFFSFDGLSGPGDEDVPLASSDAVLTQGFRVVTPGPLLTLLSGPAYELPEQGCVPGSRQMDNGDDSRSQNSGSTTGSRGSGCSYTSLGSRKGRRAFRRASNSGETGSGSKNSNRSKLKGVYPLPGLYQCTICQGFFKRRSSLERHVISIHNEHYRDSTDLWVCGPSFSALLGGRCPLCLDPRIPIHDCPHRFKACWLRPPEQRTFYRRDAVMQHLRGVHRYDTKSYFNIREFVTRTPAITNYTVSCLMGFVQKPWRSSARLLSNMIRPLLTAGATFPESHSSVKGGKGGKREGMQVLESFLDLSPTLYLHS